MPARSFITTAIDYTNGAPHIGHAYEKVLADVVARYRRLRGDDVFFLTGVDQHGQKVQQSAEKQGVAPEQFVVDITAQFVALWKKLHVEYDGWAATTEPLHKTCVQRILQRLWEEKKIYKDKQGGYYSVRQEQFLTDKERGPDGEFGPEWGQVEFREQENYYFKLAEHKEWLLHLIDSRAALVYPDFRRGELRNAVEKLAGDLCISRPKSRLEWGIELPFDADFVTYVWFDALVNYISFAPGGYDARSGSHHPEFQRWWPATIVIGKDILIPAHGIYWMIMLHALGFSDADMPRLVVHGWWNISGAKMSKSLGNVVDPNVLADTYGAAALRYYLMSDIATGKDSDFSEERLLGRYNADLANSIGNLLNRSLSMSQRYRGGVLRRAAGESPLRGQAQAAVSAYREQLDTFQVQAALTAVTDFVTACNTYVEMTAPWKLAKDPERADALDHVLYALAESLRIIAILLSPVLPNATRGIFAQLNSAGAMTLAAAEWGGLPDGHTVGKPVPLFPRIEAPPTE
ncbi:MAG: methionine--tRNA ligase [Chthoniobacterales bacterium]|nr:methionine--tRNA ligase [Chthoniobacterales bacterium]